MTARDGVAPTRVVTARRPLLREVVLAGLVLSVLTLLVYGSHVRDGGFYLDDWYLQAQTRLSPGTGYWDLVATMHERGPAAYHVLMPLSFAAHHMAFGSWTAGHLLLIALLCIVAATFFYAAARAAGVPAVAALVVAALAAICPWGDAQHFWTAAGVAAQPSVALVWLGLAVALYGADRRHPVGWHALAVVAYFFAVLHYELAAGVVPLCWLAYWRRMGLRRAAPRGACDLLAMAAAMALVAIVVPAKSSDPASWLPHATALGLNALTLLADLVPGGHEVAPWGTLPAGAALVALAAWRARAAADATPYRDALLLVAAGVVVMIGGSLALIPADPSYRLIAPGSGNRINAFNVYGLALVGVGAAGVAGAVAAELVRDRRARTAVAATCLLVLAGRWVVRVREHAAQWAWSVVAQREVIDGLRATVPTLRSGMTVYTIGHRSHVYPGVPVFGWKFDLNGLVWLLYEDLTLHAYPVKRRMRMVCGNDRVWFEGAGGYDRSTFAIYGWVLLVNTAERRAVAIDSRATCERLSSSIRPVRSEMKPS